MGSVLPLPMTVPFKNRDNSGILGKTGNAKYSYVIIIIIIIAAVEAGMVMMQRGGESDRCHLFLHVCVQHV